jgi:hypothetical protein
LADHWASDGVLKPLLKKAVIWLKPFKKMPIKTMPAASRAAPFLYVICAKTTAKYGEAYVQIIRKVKSQKLL